VFKAFIIIAIAVAIAALTAPKVEPLLLSATASLVDKSANRSAPLAQSTSDAQTSNVVKNGSEAVSDPVRLVDAAAVEPLKVADKVQTAPAADKPETFNVAAPTLTEDAVSKPVDQTQTEPQSDVLFSQYQAWAAAQKDNVAPVQDVPTSVDQNAPIQPAEKLRAVQPVRKRQAVVHNARPEPPTRSSRRPAQPVQNAQAQVPSSLDAASQLTLRSR